MNRRILIFLLASVLLHLFLILLATQWPCHPQSKIPPREKVIEVDLAKPDFPHRIADIPEPRVQQVPKHPKFLGVYDSQVEEETVAPSPAHPQAERQKEAPEKKPAPKPEPSESAPKLAKKPPEPAASEKINPLEDSGAYPADFYPDYKVGDHTYLNVLRFPKVGYFVRLKKIFKTTFNPVPVLRQQINQITRGQVEVVLGVTLGGNGRLEDVKVIHASGLQAYDAEALRTIRDSSPFAAPPKELLDANGKLRMSWTFTVYL